MGPQVASTPISAEQAAQAQAVARAAAQQFAPQFAAMFGAPVAAAQAPAVPIAAPNPNPANAPSTPLQVAAANFQAAAAALGTYPTAFPGSGPYADAFQSALFQQQAAAAAAATTQSATNFSLPMNFGGPFQQAALAQHFSQNLSNFATAASPANANTTNNAFINPPATAPAPTIAPQPASAST